MEKTLLQQYIEKFGEPIPFYEVMGNKTFETKFYGNADAVYDYCLQNNVTWQEALGFKYDDDLLY